MVDFQTKNPILGKLFEGLPMKDVGKFYGHLVYFTAIWYILRHFGVLCGNLLYFAVIWYIFPVLVFSTKKNLATLSFTV
jgi:hypothetical protein